MAFGPHLTVDCAGCSDRNLGDINYLYKFLDGCPKKIHMTKITEPYIVKIPRGFAGMVLIAESHISVHAYPAAGKLFVDIFSCKHFDKAKALKHVLSYFKPKEYQSDCLSRGKAFPRWKKKKK